MSSVVILAEALDAIVSASNYYPDEYEEAEETMGTLSFTEGLNFSLKKLYAHEGVVTPNKISLSAEDFMFNLMLTIDDAERKIRFSSMIKENRRVYFIRKLSKLKTALLYQSGENGWDDFCTNVCTEELREDLKFIGEAMGDNDLGVLINDDLDEISESILELLNMTKASKVSNKTKLAIIVQLESISTILHQYRVFGADRMEDRLKTLLAETLINYQELTETDPELTKNVHSFVAKNLKKMRSIASNIEAAQTIAALLTKSSS